MTKTKTKTKSKLSSKLMSSSSRPMSSTKSPTVWPFILSIVCCCLCCCVLPIVGVFLLGSNDRVIEGSSDDDETSLKNWQFYTIIGALVILCLCCMFYARRAGDCIRNYESPGEMASILYRIF